MKKLIPILYTIREVDGFGKLFRFLESIKGADLDSFELIIIAKSDKISFRNDINNAITSFDLDFAWNIWSTSDDGFYFSSFRRYLLEHPCHAVILLSSDAIVQNKDWAKILFFPVQSNLAPLCGSMGSWESILENKKTINLISLKKHLRRKLSFLQIELDYYYNGGDAISSKDISKSSYLPSLFLPFLAILVFLKQFGSIRFLSKSFFRFPNPHIRGCGFAITRDLFLRTVTADTQSEMDGFKIESGKKSFVNMSLRYPTFQSSALIYVGEYVEISNLKVMKTFRSESSFEPLVIDDHYLDFKYSDKARRKSLTRITWGV